MQTEAGLDVTCALIVLLRGAITQTDSKALGRGEDDPVKRRWRAKLFGQAYWVKPFGSLADVKDGLTLRIQDLGGSGLPPELERFIDWLAPLQETNPDLPLKDCIGVCEKFFQPALSACEKLSNGDLP